jgi:hypothetical protein
LQHDHETTIAAREFIATVFVQTSLCGFRRFPAFTIEKLFNIEN